MGGASILDHAHGPEGGMSVTRFASLFVSKEFVRFLLVGGVAAGFNFLSRIALSGFFSYPVAIVLAYLGGMVVAYLLFRRVVFGMAGDKHAWTICSFAMVNVIGVLQVVAVSLILARAALPLLGIRSHGEEIAHFLALCTTAFSSYVGHKYWTFRRSVTQAAPADG